MNIYEISFMCEGNYDLKAVVIADSVNQAIGLGLSAFDELLSVAVIGKASITQVARVVLKDHP